MVQALQFTSDFKLGHYMKIPPRPMFWCQVVATVIAGTVQLAVQGWYGLRYLPHYYSAFHEFYLAAGCSLIFVSNLSSYFFSGS